MFSKPIGLNASMSKLPLKRIRLESHVLNGANAAVVFTPRCKVAGIKNAGETGGVLYLG